MKIDKMIWERDPRPGYAEMRGPGKLFWLLPAAVVIGYILWAL